MVQIKRNDLISILIVLTILMLLFIFSPGIRETLASPGVSPVFGYGGGNKGGETTSGDGGPVTLSTNPNFCKAEASFNENSCDDNKCTLVPTVGNSAKNNVGSASPYDKVCWGTLKVVNGEGNPVPETAVICFDTTGIEDPHLFKFNGNSWVESSWYLSGSGKICTNDGPGQYGLFANR